MIRYPYENWMRVALGTVAFIMALLLTPRALLDIAEEADSHEIPVNLLEDPEECLWCTPPASVDDFVCDEPDEGNWLHPDQLEADSKSPCRNEQPLEEPSV